MIMNSSVDHRDRELVPALAYFAIGLGVALTDDWYDDKPRRRRRALTRLNAVTEGLSCCPSLLSTATFRPPNPRYVAFLLTFALLKMARHNTRQMTICTRPDPFFYHDNELGDGHAVSQEY